VEPSDHPLHVEIEGEGPRLVMAHGFTQTGRLWGPFGRVIAGERQLVRVDLPGHGGSSAIRADFPSAAALLIQAGGPEPFDLLGYSFGARLALRAALDSPAAVRRLVLIGGTPGIADPEARQRRRARDDAMADDLEASGGLDTFLRRWLAGPLFAGLPAGVADPEERRRNTPGGLASSLRLAGTGVQDPLWDRLSTLPVPVLAVAGALDDRFSATAVAMARSIAGGVVALVPGAGHAAHLHQPALAARIVGHWLQGC
jgi:2-succinyl-6-hydroxy-2,4-cyclohexadiene-1-carboxylate synthase